MKDYWREESPGTRPEAEIYDILAEKKVPHVATMVAGGDVEGMRTQTHEACFKLSAYPLGDSSYFRLQNPLQCHRIFLDTVARDLSAFGDCKVLVNCIADAMEAAQCAFAYARIMHRDISSGNIMITPAHRGLLIDWDLCLVLDSEALTHHPQRTGTWQFMSIGLLQGGKDKEAVVNTLDDDKESVFWVLVHTALRYLKHSLEPTELSQKLLNLFDSKALDEFGRPKGGQFKRTELPACAHDSNELATFKVPGFNNLLTELAGLLLVRYRQPTAEAVQRYEARLEKGGEVDEDNSVAIYKAKLERLADPNWLHETLRRHAKKIPLPTQPLPAISLFPQPGRAGAERAPEGSSPVTMYDFHRNEFSSEEVGIEELHARSPASISQRLDGMGWRRFVEHGTGDDGPAHKKRKLGGSKKACTV
ncbi:hypothetical protein CPB85DRAFT_1390892 [Mucidula mucida]|nr:hypothetical protein CPB85DRAFT_1390892 [Mucidula mucida]